MATEDNLQAAAVEEALAVQVLLECADRCNHVVGPHQEHFSVGDPNIPQARRARGLYLDGPRDSLRPLDYVLGVAAPEVLDGTFVVGREECAEVAEVSVAYRSSSSCSSPCVVGRNPGIASRSASRSENAVSELLP